MSAPTGSNSLLFWVIVLALIALALANAGAGAGGVREHHCPRFAHDCERSR